MKVEKTKLNGVLLITPPVMAEDFRGTNTETYHYDEYRKAGIKTNFILDSISTSRHKVLRGIHGDKVTTKLITCLRGSIYFVVVNRDPSSTHFNEWQSFTLSDKNRLQVLVPPNYGNAHLVMSKDCVFSYKLDVYYNRENQFTVSWNDPSIGIWWPINDPILSERDALL
jgi:dTDP-4-dehydrorhamnose 3,5-epimerase